MTQDNQSKNHSSDRRFRGAERLRTSGEIARVFKKKHTAAGEELVVHLSDNGLEWSRLGVITSRRVGNAVCRNAVRRRLREAFRNNKENLPKGFDIICIARPGAGRRQATLEHSLLALAARAARKAQRRPGH